MKDISKEFRITEEEFSDEHIREFAKEIEKESGVRTPPSIVIAMINCFRLYEAANISDVKENYKRLTKPVSLPLHVWYWAIKSGYNTFKKRGDILKDVLKEEEVYPTDMQIFPPKIGLNLCFMDSVKILNTKTIDYTAKGFKALEFDVEDIFGERIPGVFTYGRRRLSKSEADQNRADISQILGSNATDTFEIGFEALSEKNSRKIKLFEARKEKRDNQEARNSPEEDYGIKPELERKFRDLVGILG